MKAEDKIKERFGTETPFRLPEGSLEKLYSHVSENLPEYKIKAPERVSRWHRIRPYIYLAAMFAGIWCMMKVFHNVSNPEISLDNPPALVAEAMTDLPSYEEYSSEADINDFELEQEVIDEYSDISSLQRDFGYTLRPEYAQSKVPNTNL
ncbi:MAG: hypothetical protein HDS70_04150 [Bacteroidales bacterium]|nr:hypothetical protein [Bacteroidales bacterium]